MAKWIELTTSRVIIPGEAYITNNSSVITLLLPQRAEEGDVFRVAGKGAGGWKIAQNTGQIIHFGNQKTTMGNNGFLRSQDTFDSIEVLCITKNTDWSIISCMGNILIL